MLYVQLDVNWPDNEKIIDAGIDGAGLHAIVLCLAKRLENDGWVKRRLLHRQGADDDLIDRLVGLRLLEDGDGAVRPWGWLDRNPSQAAIAAMRASKKEASKLGNHSRWHGGVDFDQCTKCHPDLLVVADCDPIGSDPIAEHRTPTSRATLTPEVATAIAPSEPEAGKLPPEQVTRNLSHLDALKQQARPSLSVVKGQGAAETPAEPVQRAAVTNGAHS